MTKISKIMTVFVFVVSIYFMGISFMNWNAPANYAAEAEKLLEIQTSKSGDSWTIKSRATDQTLGSGKVLPEAFTKAQQALIQQEQQTSQQLDQEIPVLKARLENARKRLEEDLVALRKKAEILEQERITVSQKTVELETNSVAKSKEAQEQADLVKLRYQELLTLRSQLEECRAQTAAVKAQQKRLIDQLKQVQGDLERARRRKKTLEHDAKARYE